MPYTPIPEEIFHDEALRVWNDGAPQAASMAHARVQWSAYLSIWQQEMERDFAGLIGNKTGARLLAWIDDARFWKTFWKASANVQMDRADTQWYLRMCVDTAAAAGNVVFFESIPKAYAREMLGFLEYTTYLSDPCVVQWCTKHHPGVKVQEGLETAFRKIQWDAGAIERGVSGREGMPFVDIVNTVCRAALPFSFGQGRLKVILGHLLLYAVPQGGADNTIAAMRATLGEGICSSIDLPLVAMCSGHMINDSIQCKSIVAMARSLKHKSGPEWAVLAAIVDVENILNNKDLYNVVKMLGLHRAGPQETLDVDGALFCVNDAHPLM